MGASHRALSTYSSTEAFYLKFPFVSRVSAGLQYDKNLHTPWQVLNLHINIFIYLSMCKSVSLGQLSWASIPNPKPSITALPFVPGLRINSSYFSTIEILCRIIQQNYWDSFKGLNTRFIFTPTCWIPPNKEVQAQAGARQNLIVKLPCHWY